MLLKTDGIYLSSYNKSFKPLHILKPRFDIIGSAHNYKEISRYSDFNTFNNLFLSTVIFLFSSYIIKYFLLYDYFIPRSVPIILSLYFF